MNYKSFIAVILLLTGTISSCTRNDVYSKFISIDAPFWHADSALLYDFEITDSTRLYNVVVNVRHRADYPYQNMWIFVNQINPDSAIVKDSIEFYLADNRGKWLGKGIGAVYTMPVLINQNYKFTRQGNYRIELLHGMRDNELAGINDIGLVIQDTN